MQLKDYASFFWCMRRLRTGKTNECMIYYRIICLQWLSSKNYLNEKKLAFLLDENLLKEIWEKFIKIYTEVPLFNLTKEVYLIQ